MRGKKLDVAGKVGSPPHFQAPGQQVPRLRGGSAGVARSLAWPSTSSSVRVRRGLSAAPTASPTSRPTLAPVPWGRQYREQQEQQRQQHRVGSAPASKRNAASSSSAKLPLTLVGSGGEPLSRMARSARHRVEGEGGGGGVQPRGAVSGVLDEASQEPSTSHKTIAAVDPTTDEERIKERIQRMQLASAAAARHLREELPHQATEALLAAEARRKKMETPFERSVRLRKEKLDREAMAGIMARREEAKRDADYLRLQMNAKNVADANERQRMNSIDAKLDFIAQKYEHAPVDPAKSRAAADRYRRDLDRQNNRKKQHMWDEFVINRLTEVKAHEENLLAMGREHLLRQRQQQAEMASLKSSWAHAVDANREMAAAAGGVGVRGGRRSIKMGW